MLKSFDAPLHRTVVQISNREIPFFHRGSEDDIGIIAQTFEHRQYYPNAERFLDLELEYEKIVASNKIPLIIDAGANIGTSTVWFAENYPLSHIVSIEPDSNNFKTLAFNVANYFVDCRAAAIASVDGVGYLHDPGRGALGYVTSTDNSDRQITLLGCNSLVEQKITMGMEPFIFKCDIEGAEAELFSQYTDWVNKFFLLVAEPHDWMIKGRASSQNMLKAISQHPRDFIFYGENIFSFKNNSISV